MLAPVKEVWIRDRHLIEQGTLLVEKDESIRLFIRQRANEHRIDDTKDRGVRANAEGEREQRDDGHRRALQKHSRPKPNIR